MPGIEPGTLSSVDRHATERAKIASCEISDLYKLTYCITRVVDFPESEKQKKVVVQLGLDEELDRKKQTHGGLSLLLNQVAELGAERLAALHTGVFHDLHPGDRLPCGPALLERLHAD
ncbi:unnamed protein product [Timema podura]|uniref:Uncharacterized protein n=1 Tax=Timema podura TaxID=61482 RepID=A0ABN7P906_TIMPD|nr:unnamed protein product [Timema podura]